MMKMNSREKCIVCFKEATDGYELIKHHIQYFPEVVCYVHYKCHEEIHAGKRPELIQYQEGDSRKFHNDKKE